MIIFKPHTVVHHVRPYLPNNPIIVEAGAYDGSDTGKIASYWPDSTVHACEPVPTIYSQLKQNTHKYPNVHIHQTALSNTTGKAPFYVSEKPHKPGKICQAGSLLAPKKRLEWSPIIFPTQIMVNTITLDDWATQQQIATIHFLWLDTQGTELAILQAAPRILSTVHAIYTEVGFVEGYAHQPDYASIKQWLKSQGFIEIGRDFGDNPQWFFGNALFVRTDLIS